MKKALSLPNPTYHLMLKRNPNARFYLSPTIPYYRYDKRTDVLTVPRGALPRLRAFCDRSGIPSDPSDRRVCAPWPPGTPSLGYNVPDRPYQIGVVDALAAHEGGIVRLGTGFGKTHIALRLIHTLRQRTLVLAPRRDILEQFRRAAGDGAVGIEFRTFAKAQKESQEFLDSFGCLIVDECHQATAKGTWGVVSRCRARYRFGFTGTLERSDGQAGALEWLFGVGPDGAACLVDQDLPQTPPKVKIIPFTGPIGYGEYHEIAAALSENVERNQLIVREVRGLLDEGRRVLVLTKRVDHARSLHDLFGDPSRLALASDDMASRSARAHAFQSTSHARLLVGTYSLLSTGVDHPSLDTVVFAGDLKADTLARQSVGRVLRLLEGKLPPLIVDIQDQSNGILRAQARHRRKLFDRVGWELISEGS